MSRCDDPARPAPPRRRPAGRLVGAAAGARRAGPDAGARARRGARVAAVLVRRAARAELRARAAVADERARRPGGAQPGAGEPGGRRAGAGRAGHPRAQPRGPAVGLRRDHAGRAGPAARRRADLPGRDRAALHRPADRRRGAHHRLSLQRVSPPRGYPTVGHPAGLPSQARSRGKAVPRRVDVDLGGEVGDRTPRPARRATRVSAAAIARATAHGLRQASGAAASGPRWRISVHRNAGSSPSTASTTSSTLIAAGSRPARSRRPRPGWSGSARPGRAPAGAWPGSSATPRGTRRAGRPAPGHWPG